MNLHQLAEERSLTYHQVIAARLRQRPELLAAARERVEGWLREQDPPRYYARRWAELLAGDLEVLEAFLVDRSELAIELRQSSPFAGAITPQERWTLWRATRDRFAESA
jgi:hypothetical protein